MRTLYVFHTLFIRVNTYEIRMKDVWNTYEMAMKSYYHPGMELKNPPWVTFRLHFGPP